MNVLKAHVRITIDTLLRRDVPQREIARRTGVNSKTVRRYARLVAVATANSPGVATGSGVDDPQNPPPRPPAFVGTISACEPHRAWIKAQVVLGRNAVSICQDLVDAHGFPQRYDVLEFLSGEEVQVDYHRSRAAGALRRTHRRNAPDPQTSAPARGVLRAVAFVCWRAQ